MFPSLIDQVFDRQLFFRLGRIKEIIFAKFPKSRNFFEDLPVVQTVKQCQPRAFLLMAHNHELISGLHRACFWLQPAG
jgi:hypothetical protein